MFNLDQRLKSILNLMVGFCFPLQPRGPCWDQFFYPRNIQSSSRMGSDFVWISWIHRVMVIWSITKDVGIPLWNMWVHRSTSYRQWTNHNPRVGLRKNWQQLSSRSRTSIPPFYERNWRQWEIVISQTRGSIVVSSSSTPQGTRLNR